MGPLLGRGKLALEAVEQVKHVAGFPLAVAPTVPQWREDLGLLERANGPVCGRPGHRGLLHRAGDTDERLARELVDQGACALGLARVAGANEPVFLELLDHRREPARLAHGRDGHAGEIQGPLDGSSPRHALRPRI
jgi:hypothetical protein